MDLGYEDFIESSLDFSLQNVNNDTYLKVFDSNIVNTELKPDNFDTLTSDVDLKLENENFSLNMGFTAYEDLSKRNSDRYQYVLPYYDFSRSFFNNNNFDSFNFISHHCQRKIFTPYNYKSLGVITFHFFIKEFD